MQIVSERDKFYKMSEPIFWEKYENDFKMSSAECSTRRAKR